MINSNMGRILLTGILISIGLNGFCWGFYAHKLINFRAVFLLPPEMIAFYKPSINFITDHAVDPDKRRYSLPYEGPRHYIDLDAYNGRELPHTWSKAVDRFSGDSLAAHGIVPWWIQAMLARLTQAFKEKDIKKILKLSAETGHYVADAHVPLHTSSNHNGQFTNQQGIHGFWESRIPEMFAENEWDLVTDKAAYIKNPVDFAWKIVGESFAATDSVLSFERMLNERFGADRKYAYELRNGKLVKQYSASYADTYNTMLDGMVERRMCQSIAAVASLWYTAWVNAGKPELKNLAGIVLTDDERMEFEKLDDKWRAGKIRGRSCD